MQTINPDTNQVAECWYDTIEEPIRPLVKLLRENGINTTTSCGHRMYVMCELYLWPDMYRLYDILVLNGYDNWHIEAHWERYGGHGKQFACIHILDENKKSEELVVEGSKSVH